VSADEWKDLGLGEASPLALREVQVAEAEAGVEAARAALEQAERDLARTRIVAPFAGRIRREYVDAGEFLARGTPVATLYATDAAEIRLPVPGHDLAFADFPIQRGSGHEPAVTLRADFAGRSVSWEGRIVRTEGAIDAASRMLYVVARVENPYDTDPPLQPGLFVDASIEGRVLPDAIVLPRSALREDGTLVVLDDDNRLRRRSVVVARYESDLAVLHEGVFPGERVLVSPLATVVEGMRVRVASDAPAAPGEMTEAEPAEANR
jgi:RND family efflux transporter MFP subunit